MRPSFAEQSFQSRPHLGPPPRSSHDDKRQTVIRPQQGMEKPRESAVIVSKAISCDSMMNTSRLHELCEACKLSLLCQYLPEHLLVGGRNHRRIAPPDQGDGIHRTGRYAETAADALPGFDNGEVSFHPDSADGATVIRAETAPATRLCAYFGQETARCEGTWKIQLRQGRQKNAAAPAAVANNACLLGIVPAYVDQARFFRLRP